jgi:thioredoxin
MRNAGFKEVIELQGGIMAWNKNNLPIAGTTNSNNPGMTESEFNSLLQSAPVVLVDIYAPWCAPCKKMKPILDEIEKEYNGKVTVVRINQDEHKALCKSMNITTLPTIEVYKGGKQSFKHEGVIEKIDLVREF